jgi:hypothetical protein
MTISRKEIAMDRHARIAQAITRWASVHPTPDEPLVIAGTGRFSPRQIAHEIETKTNAGRLFLRVVENGAGNRSLTDVLKTFEIQRRS